MGLDSFLSVWVLVLMVAIHLIVAATSKLLTILFPQLNTNEKWQEVVLPAFPVLLGIALAFVPKYPLPTIVMASYGSRIIFGLVVGGFQSTGYRVVKAYVKQKWGVDVDHPSKPPGRTEEERIDDPHMIPGPAIVPIIEETKVIEEKKKS